MGDWGFWAAVGLLVVAVAASLTRAMLRARADTRAPADFDLAVYRDQLSEIERDIARGVLPAEEGERLRVEVSRRMLEADRQSRAKGAQPGRRAGSGIALLICAVLLGSVALYRQLGAPGYPDLPLAERFALSDQIRAARISQAEAEAKAPVLPPRSDVSAEFLSLMDKLRATIKERPNDPRGLELLARNEAALGNFKAAEAAQQQLIAAKGNAATGDDYAAQAEFMILAAGGFVSPETEQILVKALEADPKNPMARFYSGEMFAQVGRFDRSFILWRRLLEEGPESAPWIAPIRAQIADIAMRAGVDYTPPEVQKGPSAADIENAGQMSAEDRQAMIAGMVAQLGERLAAEGGPVQDWARLITSLSVLNRRDEAKAIYAEAKGKFAGKAEELAQLKAAADQAGVSE
jgi:cytochrome c-type biogenesis protein CcmH